jgi:biopolymer transport protein ExbD
MAIQIKKGKALDALNLTPLIDVVFLLLIFFLVATRFAQDDRELPVQLPSASSAMPMTMEPTELVINIDANGQYMVLGERMQIDRVETVLRKAVADNPINQLVIVRGDKNVAFQAVVAVMDLCSKLRVPSYKISTDPQAAP